MDPVMSPIGALVGAITAGRLSARELVTNHLARLDEREDLNAVVTRRDEQALEEADAADEAQARGDELGPLHGIPFTIKDAISTAGVRTTAGSPGLTDHVPEEDATVVARLRAAGAILIGKSNTSELTLRYETTNELFGPTAHPHDPRLSPGGSSGGAATAVAAGLSAFDIGTDTGGSIRLPAHFCGVVGCKPTAGRVPRTGVMPEGTPLNLLTQIGPLTRTVDDAARVLDVIAGPDRHDPASAPLTRLAPVQVAGMRVGVLPDNGVVTPTAPVAEAVERAARWLGEDGATVSRVDPGVLGDAGRLFVRFFTADGGEWLRRLVAELGVPDSKLAPPPPSSPPPASAWTDLLQDWLGFRREAMRLLHDRDILLLPVHPDVAQEPSVLERPDRLPGYSYAVAFNLTGWPAMSVPASTAPNGLPVGVQLVARPGAEDVLFAAARTIEAHTVEASSQPAAATDGR